MGRPRPGVAARAALGLIRGYKVLISPYFRGSCRFLPSCADYAAEAIALHGFVRGSWLASRRLARCQPLCASGYDPVPGVAMKFQPVSVPDPLGKSAASSPSSEFVPIPLPREDSSRPRA